MLSASIGRQVALLIDRMGKPDMVLVGDAQGIYIPHLSRTRQYSGRLRGVRLVHTHLGAAPLCEEDILDMVFLRLDSIMALCTDMQGLPLHVWYAHLLPPNATRKPYSVTGPVPLSQVQVNFLELVESLEEELAKTGITLTRDGSATGEKERALLVSVDTTQKAEQEAALRELADLARTAGLIPCNQVIQRVSRHNPKTIMGKGKLAELEICALQEDAGIILFEQDLTPSQMRNLADITQRKILDRSQLILDIFAQHATTSSGKLQVEMAQLQYALPRLAGTGKALSRLMGGIGGRGPGETKLELDRRRIRERIAYIKKKLHTLGKQRRATRMRRKKANLPVVALVGYTNAGKSTLLNTLTHSTVLAEDKLFATLDPATRRLRLPREKEIVLTDTVGFIRRLPPELQEAFRATLEELEEADLLLHVADAGHPKMQAQIEAVENILKEMGLDHIPSLLVLNKWEILAKEKQDQVLNLFPDAFPITAKSPATLILLSQKLCTQAFPGWKRLCV